jgi:hypothetical protein
MNCEEIRKQLSDYIDGELSPEAAAQVAAHLESCAGCREAYEEMTRLVGYMREMETVDEPADLLQKVRSRLAAKPSAWERFRELLSTPALRVPAAATVLAAILLVVLYAPTHHEPGRKMARTEAPVDITFEPAQPELGKATPARGLETPSAGLEDELEIAVTEERKELDEVAAGPAKKGEAAGREKGAAREPTGEGRETSEAKSLTYGTIKAQKPPQSPAEAPRESAAQPESEARPESGAPPESEAPPASGKPAPATADKDAAGLAAFEEAPAAIGAMRTVARDDRPAVNAIGDSTLASTVDAILVAAAVDSSGGKVVEWVYDEHRQLVAVVAEIPADRYAAFLGMLKRSGRVSEVLPSEAAEKRVSAIKTMAVSRAREAETTPADKTITVRVHIRR